MTDKLLLGFGIDDTNYPKSRGEYQEFPEGRKWRVIWTCPYYQRWVNMLRRCYSRTAHPCYIGCKVCKEWSVFSVFKNWLISNNFEGGLCLDKDLLVRGNKLYSPDTCCLLNHKTNSFLLDGGSFRGEFKIGVSYHKPNKKFRARCRNPFSNRTELLGYFSKEEDAHEAWRDRKEGLANILAEDVCDERAKLALSIRFKEGIYG